MNWKEELSKIEKDFGFHQKKDWIPDIIFIKKTLENYPNDIALNIRAIYILHHILVEEEYPEQESEWIANLLKKCFNKSYELFYKEPEYLFFIGKILYISEWYFGLDDDMKPLEDRRAFKMQKEAFELEPQNELYEWGYTFSKGENIKAFELCKQILFTKNRYIRKLKMYNFPGKYIIESLQSCYDRYKNLEY